MDTGIYSLGTKRLQREAGHSYPGSECMELHLRFPIRLHGVMMQYSQQLDLCLYLYRSLIIRKRRAYEVLVTQAQEKSPRRIPRRVQYGPWVDTAWRYGSYCSESWYGQWRVILNTTIKCKARWTPISFYMWSRSVAAHLFCTRCVKHGTRSHRFQKPRYWRPSAGTPQNHRRWGRRQSWASYAHTDDVCRPQIPGTAAVLRGCQTACTRWSNIPCYSIRRPAKLHGVTFQRTTNVSLHSDFTTYLLSPWSRVLEKLTGSQPVKKFPAFYGNRRFITAFTEVRHLSIFRATSIQFMSKSHFRKTHLNVILPSTTGSSKWSLSLRFPQQNPVCTSPLYVLHAPPILFFSICSHD